MLAGVKIRVRQSTSHAIFELWNDVIFVSLAVSVEMFVDAFMHTFADFTQHACGCVE